jgi:hypothetical protein
VSVGFVPLTDNEWTALKSFNEYGELMSPTESLNSLGSKSQVMAIMQTLCDRGLVIKGKPYKLSLRGRRVLHLLLQREELP